MNALLNIGMRQGRNGPMIGTDDAVQAIVAQGMDPQQWERVPGDQEDTLVVKVNRASGIKVDALACALGQECIAVYDLDGCYGELVGPGASLTDEFDRKRFMVL